MMQCRKEQFGFIYKKITFIALLAGSILLLPAISYAQDLPCGGNDPADNIPCPIDTGVWFLVIIAIITGSFYIKHQQKLQKQA